MLFLALISSVSGWSYSSQDSWPPACASSISPCSLDPDTAANQMKMGFLGSTGSLSLQNTGNLIRITSSDLGYIEIGDSNGRRVFNVEAVEFHTPSEHKIGGTFFPMEIEIVCTIMDRYWERDLPNLAIVSVIMKYGIENYFLNTLQVWNLPYSKLTTTVSNTSNINLRELVYNTDQYWFYNGSSTNPDLNCEENVMRYIIQDVKEGARWQIDGFSQLFATNNTKELSLATPSLYYSSSSVLLTFITLLLL